MKLLKEYNTSEHKLSLSNKILPKVSGSSGEVYSRNQAIHRFWLKDDVSSDLEYRLELRKQKKNWLQHESYIASTLKTGRIVILLLVQYTVNFKRCTLFLLVSTLNQHFHNHDDERHTAAQVELKEVRWGVPCLASLSLSLMRLTLRQ